MNKAPVELGPELMRVDSHALLWGGGGDVSKQLTKVAANFDTLSSSFNLKGAVSPIFAQKCLLFKV